MAKEDSKSIMASRFPKFSQGLSQDPTTRRIWFGIATAHDFESHDDITEERLPVIYFMLLGKVISKRGYKTLYM
jgi:Photosystem I psaA/psaB protein